MATFGICAVRLDHAQRIVAAVRCRLLLPAPHGGIHAGAPFVAERAHVLNALRLGDRVYTLHEHDADDTWRLGAQVVLEWRDRREQLVTHDPGDALLALPRL
jgi:hypothetical protein